MDKPAITVLMSVHNGEKYLKEAIESVLSQTFKDFEFIIINDASTDGTAIILSQYADPQIRIIKNENNIGLTKSLNIGLKEARGEYVARMDADDIALPERLETEKRFLDSHSDIAVVGSSMLIINKSGQQTGKKQVIENTELIHFRNIFANQLSHPTVMFRKTTIIKNGGYDEGFQYVQDYDLWSRLLGHGYLLSNLRAPLIKYRYHEKSITQAKKSKDSAYSYAIVVIRRNISHYVSFSENDFSWFLKSFHRHEVGSLGQALSIINFLSLFKNKYLNIEMPSDETREHIKIYIRNEQIRALQWWAKLRFGILYELLVKGARFIESNKK